MEKTLEEIIDELQSEPVMQAVTNEDNYIENFEKVQDQESEAKG